LVLNQVLQSLCKRPVNARLDKLCIVLEKIDLKRLGIDFSGSGKIIRAASEADQGQCKHKIFEAIHGNFLQR
jgi:hypothetical protein